MNAEVFLHTIKNKVVQEDAYASVILYGSRARGDFKEDSDWDILVLTSRIGDKKLEEKIRDNIYELQLEFLQPVSTIIIEKENWLSKHLVTGFYQNVITEGITL